MKCRDCPRDGEPRLRSVPNFGLAGPFVLEVVHLCDGCAVLRNDVFG